MLTSKEIYLILQILREKYGSGYSSVEEISALQVKLSIMLEVAHRREAIERGI